jgi:hypothetical protein
MQSTGRVGVSLVRVSATGTETTIANEVTVAGVTYTASTNLRIRLQVTGTNPTGARQGVAGVRRGAGYLSRHRRHRRFVTLR